MILVNVHLKKLIIKVNLLFIYDFKFLCVIINNKSNLFIIYFTIIFNIIYNLNEKIFL